MNSLSCLVSLGKCKLVVVAEDRGGERTLNFLPSIVHIRVQHQLPEKKVPLKKKKASICKGVYWGGCALSRGTPRGTRGLSPRGCYSPTAVGRAGPVSHVPGVQLFTSTPTATLSKGKFSFRELPIGALGKACRALA